MTLKFEIPIVYKNLGIPPKCRNRQEYTVRDTGWFEFPVADTSELEPALTFRVHYRRDENSEIETADTVFKQYRGHLMRDVATSSHQRDQNLMDLNYLSGLSSWHTRDLPPELRVKSNDFRYGYGTQYPAGKLNAKHIIVCRRDAAIEELQAFITDNLVIVDGVVYGKIHDPKINVYVNRFGYSVEPSLIASGNYSFPFDRMDLVDEFTGWLETEHGLSRKQDENEWKGDRTFIIEAPEVPLSANPVIEAALELSKRAELNVTNVDYYGAYTKRLGIAFLETPTVDNAFAFVDAFEDAATLPGAHKFDYGLENVELHFSSYRKFVELIPDEYKPGFTETISIPIDFPTWAKPG